jgi:anti-anti-sigma factor
MSHFESPPQAKAGVRPFKITERRIWPGCVEIEVEGELDCAVSPQLQAALDRVLSEPCHVLLGFGACEFIDSSGLAILVGGNRTLAAHGKQLLLYGVHGQVRRMLSLTGLAESGLLVSEGSADPRLLEEIRALEQSFSVTVAGGESVRLTRPQREGQKEA